MSKTTDTKKKDRELATRYRRLAQQHLEFAKQSLEGGNESQLRLTALELRMALEALTYSRALSYKSDLTEQDLSEWRPRQLMNILLDLDPMADTDYTLSVSKSDSSNPGANGDFIILGSERIIGVKELREHYDALGNFMHIPSLKQVQNDSVQKFQRLEKRCIQIVDFIEEALASIVFNSTFGEFSTIECERCHQKIRKRLPPKGGKRSVECDHCNLQYELSYSPEGSDIWTQIKTWLPCSGCSHETSFWKGDVKIGLSWTCDKCTGTNTVAAGITFSESSSKK